ncbi:MAG: hypothetical protein QF507_06735 [Vicinamibacterales bacterium]|jgi:hypothetical protein|nr:hypothetical protein [Vicinamibacterales bacterium]HJO17840.1 hypothetical protein [Vicinamibacterales bacterium]|tara:strand:- start:1148 stop:1456 length:309 start_codon:yes stop_codon:yes gene_type:complete
MNHCHRVIIAAVASGLLSVCFQISTESRDLPVNPTAFTDAVSRPFEGAIVPAFGQSNTTVQDIVANDLLNDREPVDEIANGAGHSHSELAWWLRHTRRSVLR